MIKNRIYIKDLVAFIGENAVSVVGDFDNVYVDNLADSNRVNELSLDWINPNKIESQEIAESTRAKVILVDKNVKYSEELRKQKKILLIVDNPKLILATIGNAFFVKKNRPEIHSTAIVDSEAVIGNDVYIGPYVVIGKAVIGDNCYISSNVRIYDDVEILNNCFIKEGAVIGGAGFGFEIDEQGNRFRFPQIGGVKIGHDVEIGANTCIDRGALSDTVIEDYVKIDNLCHIAHNVCIKKNVVITACSEVSGSCVIGEYAWLGPNSSVRDWRVVGKNSLVGIGSVVVKNVPEHEVWAGVPAKKC